MKGFLNVSFFIGKISLQVPSVYVKKMQYALNEDGSFSCSLIIIFESKLDRVGDFKWFLIVFPLEKKTLLLLSVCLTVMDAAP